MIDVVGKRFTFDKFHRQIRLAFAAFGLADTGVVEFGDVRMIEFGKDVALAAEAFAPDIAVEINRWQLECNLPFNATIGLFGEPDFAHAAAADLLQQFERANQLIVGKPARWRRHGC